MAKRGAGELFGSLLRAGLRGLDGMREVVVETGKAGKVQLDLTLLRRRRREALADLGAAVAQLARDGRVDEDAFPELGAPLSRLESIDEEIATTERRGRGVSDGGDGGDGDDGPDEEYDR